MDIKVHAQIIEQMGGKIKGKILKLTQVAALP
jgi:hypothetical protein